MKPQGRRPGGFTVSSVWKPDETRVFEMTSPIKKISLNYHLNKFSQFNYLRREMCMILSPNCSTVTIFEYSSTDVTLLPPFVSCERKCCFAKQMAQCRFRSPKTSKEEEKCVASAIPR